MLTPDDAAAVLRRAAELDTPSLESYDGLEERAVREAAREVGLSDAAVEQAVQEWRSGVLEPLPPLSRDTRLGLHGTVVVETRVSLPVDRTTVLLEAWLRTQWFEKRRTRGPESEWAPRRGPVAKLRRAVDLTHDLRLSGTDRLRVCVAPAASGTRVRLVADLGDTRAGLLTGLVAFPAAVVGVGVGIVADGGVAVDVLTALPAVAGAGGLGWLGARGVLEARRRRLEEELERAVDALAVGAVRPPIAARAVGWAKGRR